MNKKVKRRMDLYYEITSGNVKKYSGYVKTKIRNVHNHNLGYPIACIGVAVLSYVVFRLCIAEQDGLAQTIALGSIFATFGSSLVTVFSLKMDNYYDRFISNCQVLFQELEPQNAWHRWAFIKRTSHQNLFENQYSFQVLTNARVDFDVGSHKISVYIPTIKEDFYDLQNEKALCEMKRWARDYESNVFKSSDESIVANSLMVWDCIYDNLKCIRNYKMARIVVILGEACIIASLLLAFFYSKISELEGSICQLLCILLK